LKSKNVIEIASSKIAQEGSSSVVQTKSKAKINFSRKAESEFFVDNSALAGFTGERILYMAIRELIENSGVGESLNDIRREKKTLARVYTLMNKKPADAK
jgi:hypothetical protein